MPNVHRVSTVKIPLQYNGPCDWFLIIYDNIRALTLMHQCYIVFYWGEATLNYFSSVVPETDPRGLDMINGVGKRKNKVLLHTFVSISWTFCEISDIG